MFKASMSQCLWVQMERGMELEHLKPQSFPFAASIYGAIGESPMPAFHPGKTHWNDLRWMLNGVPPFMDTPIFCYVCYVPKCAALTIWKRVFLEVPVQTNSRSDEYCKQTPEALNKFCEIGLPFDDGFLIEHSIRSRRGLISLCDSSMMCQFHCCWITHLPWHNLLPILSAQG